MYATIDDDDDRVKHRKSMPELPVQSTRAPPAGNTLPELPVQRVKSTRAPPAGNALPELPVQRAKSTRAPPAGNALPELPVKRMQSTRAPPVNIDSPTEHNLAPSARHRSATAHQPQTRHTESSPRHVTPPALVGMQSRGDEGNVERWLALIVSRDDAEIALRDARFGPDTRCSVQSNSTRANQSQIHGQNRRRQWSGAPVYAYGD